MRIRKIKTKAFWFKVDSAFNIWLSFSYLFLCFERILSDYAEAKSGWRKAQEGRAIPGSGWTGVMGRTTTLALDPSEGSALDLVDTVKGLVACSLRFSCRVAALISASRRKRIATIRSRSG